MSENKTKIYGNARYLFRRDTLENWNTINPSLLAGEICIVTNPKSSSEMLKICTEDNTNWNDLEYVDIVGKSTALGGEIFNDYESNEASELYAHTEGGNNKGKSRWGHVEGFNNTLEENANGSHIEGGGNITKSGASYSHNDGYCNKINENAKWGHVGGGHNQINNVGANAHGVQLQTTRDYQSVVGVANATINQDSRVSKALFQVGNGTLNANSVPTKQSSAFMVFEDGSAAIQKQGTSDDSVVILSYLKSYIAEKLGEVETSLATLVDVEE